MHATSYLIPKYLCSVESWTHW